MKFREHRESLEDALKTVVEISPTREALLKYINKIYNKNYTIEKLDVKYYIFDERINWDTCIVTVDGNTVGFTNMLI